MSPDRNRGGLLNISVYFSTILVDRVRASMGKLVVVFVFLIGFSLFVVGQSNTGELRLRVMDPSGRPIRTPVLIISEANQYRRILSTDEQGSLAMQRLPYGVYQIQISQPDSRK